MNQNNLIHLLDGNLMFTARMESTLSQLGYEVKTFPRPSKAVEAAELMTPALAIVSYISVGDEFAHVVGGLKALGIPVLCYMPHTQMPAWKQLALDAGANLVVANSAISMRLPQLIEKLMPQKGQAQWDAAAELAEEDKVV